MRAKDASTDRFTFLNAVKTCVDLIDLNNGRCVHGHLVKCGWELENRIGGGLIEFYNSCENIASARKIFDEMPVKDSVLWTIAISGYVNSGDMGNARSLFDEMPDKDLVVWGVLILGYVKAGEITRAHELFNKAPKKDLLIYNTMLRGFASASLINDLLLLLDEMPERDIVSWNTAISGLVHCKRIHEAIIQFHRMQLENQHPNEVTLSTLLSGCADAGALKAGRSIHSYISSQKDTLSLLDHPIVETSLIDMYSKCGELEAAWFVFSGMINRDTATWNAMITGFYANGENQKALELFQEMMGNTRPNAVTMVAVLSACAHAGLVKEGKEYFKSMESELGIRPQVEHYGCMVDLLGRAGLLLEAQEVICSMPMEPHVGVWGALLGACQIHGEVELAELAMKRLLDLGDEDGGYVAIMGNIYVAAGRWSDAARVREVIRERGLIKAAGHSSVDHCVKENTNLIL